MLHRTSHVCTSTSTKYHTILKRGSMWWSDLAMPSSEPKRRGIQDICDCWSGDDLLTRYDKGGEIMI